MHTSFLIPIYDTDVAVLRLCINSALKAAGDQHEVILVDDASRRSETLDFLDRCKASGLDNLKILQNSENCGVSYSLNKAAAAATGKFYAPVDHDDMVVTDGVQHMWRYIRYYKIRWTYSDEAQISYKGVVKEFMHKPQYSPQLLRSVMYINHLQIMSSELFHGVGGYREGFEGSQDHDLALRLSEITTPEHVALVAYLWRRGSTSQSVQYGKISTNSIQASIRALEEHHQRLNVIAKVEPVTLLPDIESSAQYTGTYISRILPSTVPKVSIVIPCKLGTTTIVDGKTVKVLEHCLKSIHDSLLPANGYTLEIPAVEIVLVLNQEDDVKTGEHLLAHFDLQGVVISDEAGFNFARKCNLGARHSSGDILIFLNDDTDFQTHGWTSHVISLLTEDDVACVGGMLLNADRTVQSCGDNVGRNSAVHYVPDPSPSSVGDMMHRYIADHETTSITGAFLCCRKDTFMNMGSFSTTFPNSFQDVDFCLRARKNGLRCIISPHIKVLHFESATRNPEVDEATLWCIRTFHQDSMGPVDPYGLFQYETPVVSLFSRVGLEYYLNMTKTRARRAIGNFLIRLKPGPQHPRGILWKSEWRVH